MSETLPQGLKAVPRKSRGRPKFKSAGSQWGHRGKLGRSKQRPYQYHLQRAGGTPALRLFLSVSWRLRDGLSFVEAGVVVEGGEGTGLHAIDVESAVEMVNFVLEDAGVPAGGLDELSLSVFVEILDSNGTRSGNDGGKTGEAEAAFVEILFFVAGVSDHGIDDDVKRDGTALALGKLLGRQSFQQIFAVFDHCELQRQAYLWCGEADARSVTHGFAHIAYEPLNFFADNFGRREGAGCFAQNRFARLHNFQAHCVSLR